MGFVQLLKSGFSELTVIVIDSPPGPLPKNCGFWEVIVSPSVKLSKITLVGFGEEEGTSILNFDSWVAVLREDLNLH